jgi:hypothetical protein
VPIATSATRFTAIVNAVCGDNIDPQTLTETERDPLAYALEDPSELHTMLMTSPVHRRPGN